MKGSYKIASVADIPVKVHWTFGLLVLGLAYVAYASNYQMALVGWLALFILALYFCVILHEYGHALTARHYGVKTRDIILSPIGGVARLERLPEKPWQEFFIALAGPMVNIGICFVMVPYFAIYSFDGIFDILAQRRAPSITDLSLDFLPILFLLNIVLAAFNLLPAFPMDGGRVFRALLSIRLGRRKATQIAAYLGQALAIGFMVYGAYMGSVINIFIGLFVFITASQENRMVRIESILTENKVADILREQFTRLQAEDTLQLAVDRMKTGVEKNFLVMDETQQKVLGVLHEEFIAEAVKNKDEQTQVLHYLSDRFEAVSPEENLKSIFYKMQEKGYSILPVYEAENLIGVIDVSMMNNFLAFQQKLKK